MVTLGKAMALITEEAPAHFMWRTRWAWGLSPEIEYDPVPTTEIRAVEIFVDPGGRWRGGRRNPPPPPPPRGLGQRRASR